MQKLFFLLTVVFSTLIAGCGEKEKDKPVSVPGMSQIDLSGLEFNYPVTILVPDSTNGPMEITPQSWGAIEIKVAEEFQISIALGEGETVDMVKQKSFITGDDVKKLKRYIIDEPTIVFYETEIPGLAPEFHFYAIIKAGDKQYVVEDLKGTAFSEAAVQKMVDSAKSLSLKEKPEASS